MKSLLLLALCVFPLAAEAARNPIQCQDLGGGPDHGYLVSIHPSMARATLSEQTIAGPRSLTELHCRRNRRPRFSRHPDQLRVIATCQELRRRHPAYSLTLLDGGIMGFLRAELFEKTPYGPPIQRAILRCK